jgi:hypothetical protein
MQSAFFLAAGPDVTPNHKPMTPIVFILTGDDRLGTNRYLASLRLAARTVKHFHPRSPIYCLGDEACRNIFETKNSPLSEVFDEMILCGDASGGVVHRSRVIKTTLRQRLKGPFVYLDTDTVLVGDIQPLLDCQSPVGLVADSWFPESVGQFPAWCLPIYRDLQWKHPTKRYFNSGVFFVEESEQTHLLFEEWQRRYSQTVSCGINLDQPSFNSALEYAHTRVEEFSEDFNFFCGRIPRPIPSTSKVLHVCCSLPSTRIPIYEAAVHALQSGREVCIEDFVIQLKKSGIQIPQKWRAFYEIRRRAYEYMHRTLCKIKWISAEKC